MKKPATIKAKVTKPRAPKPRKRPTLYGVTWYDIELKEWRAKVFGTDNHCGDPIVVELLNGKYAAAPDSVRLVTIEGGY